ncbi:hypothetical protein [Lihuaxuella thermophila]|uniref:Uncharacterized protein n=1 Tax=Lihuaxuella thermophila TaxID=1173111 RepID=A0A1H8F7I7_9BACL|nr:hypothetical protein [Lihuaxuella thermophila]SEN27008.1 hypothetical protein SAMN05444955_10826 [Lihuaxuella thermophila]
MHETNNRSLEQKKKEAESRDLQVADRNVENKPGYGNKKLEGPDRPST